MWMPWVIWLSLCEEMSTEEQRRIVDYQMLLRATSKKDIIFDKHYHQLPDKSG